MPLEKAANGDEALAAEQSRQQPRGKGVSQPIALSYGVHKTGIMTQFFVKYSVIKQKDFPNNCTTISAVLAQADEKLSILCFSYPNEQKVGTLAPQLLLHVKLKVSVLSARLFEAVYEGRKSIKHYLNPGTFGR